MKIKHLLFAAVTAVLTLCACSNKDIPTPEPEPEPEEISDFNFKSSDIMEFKQITEGEAIDIVPEEAEDFFGKSIEFITPVKLQFYGDSLSIVKPHGMTEGYAVKWAKDELLLYNDLTDNWEYCGKSNENNRFYLNTGVFKSVSKNKQRTLYVAGQDYALTSYDQIPADPDDVVIWLRLELVFEK